MFEQHDIAEIVIPFVQAIDGFVYSARRAHVRRARAPTWHCVFGARAHQLGVVYSGLCVCIRQYIKWYIEPSDNHAETMRQHGAGVVCNGVPIYGPPYVFRVNRERGTKLHGGGGLLHPTPAKLY